MSLPRVKEQRLLKRQRQYLKLENLHFNKVFFQRAEHLFLT